MAMGVRRSNCLVLGELRVSSTTTNSLYVGSKFASLYKKMILYLNIVFLGLFGQGLCDQSHVMLGEPFEYAIDDQASAQIHATHIATVTSWNLGDLICDKADALGGRRYNAMSVRGHSAFNARFCIKVTVVCVRVRALL